MAGFTGEVLDGISAAIAAAGIGTARTDGSAYLAGETAITFGALPQNPDRAIALTAYPISAAPRQALNTVGVQIMTRGLPNNDRDVSDLRDSIFQLLQGLVHQQYGATHAVQILWKSGVPMGEDLNNRTEHSDNYYIDINPPSTAARNNQ